MPRPIVNILGLSFGRWTVVEYVGQKYWRCACLCGKENNVRSDTLMSGISKSCGCLNAENLAARKKTHGLTESAEYTAWLSAKTRCFNSNEKYKWSRYGGRGITMSDLWVDDFEAFLAYVGKRPTPLHSLDRFPDNDGNYEPGNVRWATPSEQQNNKSNNVKRR